MQRLIRLPMQTTLNERLVLLDKINLNPKPEISGAMAVMHTIFSGKSGYELPGISS